MHTTAQKLLPAPKPAEFSPQFGEILLPGEPEPCALNDDRDSPFHPIEFMGRQRWVDPRRFPETIVDEAQPLDCHGGETVWETIMRQLRDGLITSGKITVLQTPVEFPTDLDWSPGIDRQSESRLDRDHAKSFVTYSERDIDSTIDSTIAAHHVGKILVLKKREPASTTEEFSFSLETFSDK